MNKETKIELMLRAAGVEDLPDVQRKRFHEVIGPLLIAMGKEVERQLSLPVSTIPPAVIEWDKEVPLVEKERQTAPCKLCGKGEVRITRAREIKLSTVHDPFRMITFACSTPECRLNLTTRPPWTA